MHRIVSLALALALIASAADAAQCRGPTGKFIKCPPPPVAATTAPKCKTGIPCGHTCIARGKVCHKS